MALDVDVVECHGSGRFIADAIEVPNDPTSGREWEMPRKSLLTGNAAGLIEQ